MKLVWILLLLIPIAAAQKAENLHWMAGCWSGTQGAMVFEEQWFKPAGGMLLGAARNVKNGKVVFHEFMRIQTTGDQLTFTPRIGSNQAPVVFTSIRQSDTEIVFENATHDFPQRILYRRTNEGLFARIEGLDKGKPRWEDYPMRRIACE